MTDERTFYIGPTRQLPEGPAPAQRKEPSEAFRFVNDLHNKTLEYQFSVARWIMASLLIINGGGILALMNAAKDFPDALSGGGFFLGGIVTAILSGMFTWFNCNLVGEAATDRLDWQRLDTQDPPSADAWDRRAMVCAGIAVLLAFASLALFSAGAWKVKGDLEQASAKRIIPGSKPTAAPRG